MVRLVVNILVSPMFAVFTILPFYKEYHPRQALSIAQ